MTDRDRLYWECGDCGHRPRIKGHPGIHCPRCRGDHTWRPSGTMLDVVAADLCTCDQCNWDGNPPAENALNDGDVCS